MRIKVTSDILEHEYDGVSVLGTDFVLDYVENADNLLVPGVHVWQNVNVTFPGPNTVVIAADLVADDEVKTGEYRGQEVSEAWIKDYILGADAYWLAPGVLKATQVTFS